jgi:hypothetical protein
MLRAVSAIVMVAALATLAYGQRDRRNTAQPASRDITPAADLEREMAQRSMEEQLNKPLRQREQHLSFMQISEDFKRIQLVNNDLVVAASRDAALDLKFVAKSASEIRKLAVRLKDNLVLPEPEKGFRHVQAEIEPEAGQLKASLLALGKLVAGFAHNPVFKEPNVVDAQMSAKARRDLEEIITLSDQVRKSSEKLNKLAQKTQ